jgi:hypothetical protein
VDQLIGRHGDVGGVAGSPPRESQHLVTGREVGDTVAHGGHHAGQVAALAGGEGRREPVVYGSRADLGLAGVDSRGPDRYHHLIGRRHGHGHVGDIEDIPVAVVVEVHRPCAPAGHLALPSVTIFGTLLSPVITGLADSRRGLLPKLVVRPIRQSGATRHPVM